jgi:biotin carboxyl carrier protein
MMSGLWVVVAPGAGRIRLLPPVRFAHGAEVVARGQRIAVVQTSGGDRDVVTAVGGVVDGLLVHEGEPVHAGQPVMAVRT